MQTLTLPWATVGSSKEEVPQIVEKEDHEVVDNIGLIALSTCVYIDGNAGILQRNPL